MFLCLKIYRDKYYYCENVRKYPNIIFHGLCRNPSNEFTTIYYFFDYLHTISLLPTQCNAYSFANLLQDQPVLKEGGLTSKHEHPQNLPKHTLNILTTPVMPPSLQKFHERRKTHINKGATHKGSWEPFHWSSTSQYLECLLHKAYPGDVQYICAMKEGVA